MNIRLAASAVSLAVLAGCGTPPVGRSLYPTPTQPQAQAAAAVPQAAAAQVGSIRVVVAGAGFQTQSTAADVANVQITVTPSTGQAVTQMAAKGTTAQINNIPVGPATVTVAALDASGSSIGSATQNVTVTAGQVASVSMSIQLAPTVVAPQTGGVAVNINLIDGATISPSPSPTATPIPTPTPTAIPTATPIPSPTPSATPTASPTPLPTILTSFNDGFENGLGNWTTSFSAASYMSGPTTPTSNWNATAWAAKTGSYSASPGDPMGKVYDPGTYLMTYKAALDTAGMANPTLTFDYENFVPQYYFMDTALSVETSTDGITWTPAWTAGAEQDPWAHVVVNLPQASTLFVRYDFKYDYYLGRDAMSAPCIDNAVFSNGGM